MSGKFLPFVSICYQAKLRRGKQIYQNNDQLRKIIWCYSNEDRVRTEIIRATLQMVKDIENIKSWKVDEMPESSPTESSKAQNILEHKVGLSI